MSSADVLDVAAYFLKEQQGRMTTMKLQKLCYYAQAWSLVWDDEPLFRSEINAWANGPVCPDLFAAHRGKFWIADGDLPAAANPSRLTLKQRETCEAIQHNYGRFSGTQLSALTHQEAPWLEARASVLEGDVSKVPITHTAMRKFYGEAMDSDDEAQPVADLEFPAWVV